MQLKNIRFIVALIGLVALLISTSPVTTQAQIITPQRGIGLSVTFPFGFLPTVPLTNTATFFLSLLAQGQINEQLVHQTELRFFIDSLGFQTALTSIRESLLILFTPSPASFYIGAGLGAFPIRVPAVPSDGFLLSFLVRAGVEVQVFPLGLFLDITYETMPQPFADIDGGTFTPATLSALELTFGALIHF